jgi:transcriptional regulator with XRE-family HTH domain
VESEEASRRLGQLVRQRREFKGWTQEQIARAMSEAGFGWVQNTAFRVERGQRDVRFGEAVALAAMLNIDLMQAAGPHTFDLRQAEARSVELAMEQVQLEEEIKTMQERLKSLKHEAATWRVHVQRLRKEQG